MKILILWGINFLYSRTSSSKRGDYQDNSGTTFEIKDADPMKIKSVKVSTPKNNENIGINSTKQALLFVINFVLGLLLAFSFEPFNLPFLSLIVIGIYFLLNDHAFKTLKSHYKIFFYNGLFLATAFFIKHILGIKFYIRI